MPVEELAHRPGAERDLRGGQSFRPVWGPSQVDRLDVRLAVSARVESERSHRGLPSILSERREMLAQARRPWVRGGVRVVLPAGGTGGMGTTIRLKKIGHVQVRRSEGRR